MKTILRFGIGVVSFELSRGKIFGGIIFNIYLRFYGKKWYIAKNRIKQKINNKKGEQYDLEKITTN